ncbi:hypothetical protein [Brevibacterium atlanticum]|uniref:hypothetical protein n=1 Tax=Brevibacterium atlanticum TaxID=2697563 RepID=UPI001D197533|nr:hypothetical protein [Brevibacterium atlanticum]
MTETTEAELLSTLRARIRDAWQADPVFIDPIIAAGLTDNQRTAIEKASQTTAETGLSHFVAIVPGIAPAAEEDWSRFTSDLAYAMHKDSGEDQTLVLISEAENAARSYAYLVGDSGPAMPKAADMLARSGSDDFLPVELAVPYQLGVLVAAARSTDPPAPPDFDTRDVGDRDEDYIEATGLDNDNPDGLVFAATAAAALGVSVWLLRRRTKYSWRKSLTTSPTLVGGGSLERKAQKALEPLPEPIDDESWDVYDRGRRVQEALSTLLTDHPDWAEDRDFSHRHAVNVLVTTARWVRARLHGSASADQEPRFCFLFPHHRTGVEEFVLRQPGTTLTVDLCADCRNEIDAGGEPERLMVPKRRGSRRPVPYFRRSDAYAQSGFGSFQPLEDALLDSRTSPEATSTGGRR